MTENVAQKPNPVVTTWKVPTDLHRISGFKKLSIITADYSRKPGVITFLSSRNNHIVIVGCSVTA